MQRLTEASLKYNFVIEYKKGCEIPADLISRNAIDRVGIFSDQWKLAHEQNEFFTSIKNTCTLTQTIAPTNNW
jgi:hypothetical protein